MYIYSCTYIYVYMHAQYVQVQIHIYSRYCVSVFREERHGKKQNHQLCHQYLLASYWPQASHTATTSQEKNLENNYSQEDCCHWLGLIMIHSCCRQNKHSESTKGRFNQPMACGMWQLEKHNLEYTSIFFNVQ